MTFGEELKQLSDNAKKDVKRLYEKIKQYPLISLLFIIAVFLLIAVPHWQVSEINNVTEKVTQENQSRATLAQVLGGAAIGITLYYTWRRITIAEEELKATQEGQITERFTRAVDQLGNEKLEIRLGGIYALERIANESEKDYWPIIEILTTYVRMNSRIDNMPTDTQGNESITKGISEIEIRILPVDIQTILTVLGRRRYTHNNGESKNLNLTNTCLDKAELEGAHFEEAYINQAHLKGASLDGAHFEGTCFVDANLDFAWLKGTHLERADIRGASITIAELTGAYLLDAHLEGANLENSFLENAHLNRANLTLTCLKDAYLPRTDLREAILGGLILEELG